MGAFKSTLALGAYATALRLATPIYLWRVWSRGREEPGYRADWPWRLGCGLPPWPQAAGVGPRVWLHAVSLGETRAAVALVAALRARCPGLQLLLTHSTATGREAGRSLIDPARGDVQTWLPYDTPGAVRRFLRHYRPQVGVLMETEIWPVLQHEARQAGVPMVLANARLSDKSLRQGQRLAALLRPAVSSLAAVLAQTQADARRFAQMLGDGHPAPVVSVAGNVKFDMTPPPELLARGQAWRAAARGRPIVLAASTREGEEAGLLAAWKACTGTVAPGERPLLLLVPRHPQRFDEVEALVQAQGLSVVRRSAWGLDAPTPEQAQADVWLGDSMGEMPAYFAAAQAALLGGSFAPLGGQNLIEAAACGCPIVLGPSTFNFEEAATLSLDAGAARRVADIDEGVRAAIAWAVSSGREADVQRCLAFSLAHRGAALRMAQAITDLLA